MFIPFQPSAESDTAAAAAAGATAIVVASQNKAFNNGRARSTSPLEGALADDSWISHADKALCTYKPLCDHSHYLTIITKVLVLL